jgi:hypothetical protein
MSHRRDDRTAGSIFWIRTDGNFRFKRCVIPPPDLDGLTPAQLRELVATLLTKMAELEQKNVGLREEIARVKGLKGRPDIKPSGMDKGTGPARPDRQGKPSRRGRVRARVSVEELLSRPARASRATRPIPSRTLC